MSRIAVVLVSVLLTLPAGAALQAADPTSGLSAAGAPEAKPPAVNPPAPQPDVIRQGGDTCAAATVISGLPFSDTGTTVGYTNDYDEVCPYTGSTSPDVVYAFTPAADVTVDVNLCVGTTSYDTKLYVYQGTCGSPNLACNDDACSSPLSDYVSQLTGLSLTAGQTYYFVVDGYGGASGNYTIELNEAVPPPPTPTCDMAAVIYGQNPDDPTAEWNAATSGQTTSFDYTVAEGFDGTDMSIADLHWYGLALVYGDGWQACPTPGALTFDVRFYADDAGALGAEICSYTAVAPAITDTTLLYSGYSLYTWDVPALTPACLPTGASWVTIKSLTNANDCTFLWMSGTGGNAGSLQYADGAWGPLTYDLGMCLTGAIVPVELQAFTAE